MDERVVPTGEYRDALNIQVSASDGSDVGSAQSLLGNVLMSTGMVPVGSKCVGSIAHNKEDKIYYLVAGPRYEKSQSNVEGVWKDYIIEYDVKTETFKYVFVDIYRVHARTVSSSVGSEQFFSSGVVGSNFRKEMIINGYNASGTHIIGNIYGEVTEVSQVYYNSPPSIDVWSSKVDYNTTSIPVNTLLQCTAKRVLNFSYACYDSAKCDWKDKYITGINIIDDMLFWTDNDTEPKKINITRSISGTGGTTELPDPLFTFNGDNADWHTRLCVTPDSHNGLRVKKRSSTLSWWVAEENITVIRKGPKTPPLLVMSKHEDDRDAPTFSTCGNISGPPSTGLNSFMINWGTSTAVKNPGDVIGDFTLDQAVHWKIGDMILMNQDYDEEGDVNSAEGFTEHDVRATVTSVPGTIPNTLGYQLTIQSIDRESIDEENKTWRFRLEEKKPMFEFKFVRFAYRYKYEDGEYSTFSPWSELAFLPGEYDYLPKKGYNLGMTNRLRQLKITNYITEESERPQDVVQVDLLYKDESSPNIYTVESIKMTDGWTVDGEKLWPDSVNHPSAPSLPSWFSYSMPGFIRPRGEYEVTSELIHATVPSNQLLRQWDNVPRKALAQEITSNRLVYGNYLQNFNLTHDWAESEIKPVINVTLQASDAPLNDPTGSQLEDSFSGLEK